MAGIDSSIYFQQQPLDILGNVQRGLSMRDMLDKRNIQQAEIAKQKGISDAYSQGLVQNPDGTVSFDSAKTLSAMAGVPGAGRDVFDAKNQFRAQDLADQKARYEKAQQVSDFFGRVASQVKDQSSYDQAINQARSMGADTSMMPPQWGPDAKQKIDFYHGQALTAQQQIENDMKARGLNIQQQEANAKTSEATSKNKSLDLEMKKLYGGASATGLAPTNPNGEIDPAKLVPSMVPQHHQSKAFDEIEAAQNTKANASKILEAFDNAAKNVNFVDFVPGMQNADQKAFHTLLGPTFKDVEGTVRQAAMDNMFGNTTPQFGDSKETTKKKRASVVEYLNSKSSAPTAMGYGIDLKKYPSTAPTGEHPADNAMITWAKQNPNATGAADVLKANGL